MATRDINDLDANSLHEGIKLCVTNAEDLFRSANILKASGYLGAANSLFILSCEESIKAFVLFNKFLIDDDRDITPMFKNHKEKLEVAMQGYHLISCEVRAMVRSFRDAKVALPAGSESEIESEARRQWPSILSEIEADTTLVLGDMDWWGQQNDRKNQGLYVGYRNGWVVPQQITVETIDETAQKALVLLTHVYQYRDLNLDLFHSAPASSTT